MIIYKTEQEINIMREAAQIVSRTLGKCAEIITPGITPFEMDKMAEDYILSQDAIPGFKGLYGCPSTLLISVNEGNTMATLTKDDVWKVIQMGLGMLVIPLGGWVWNMNVEVAELRNDLGDAEGVIESLEKKLQGSDDNARQIIGIEKDIEYMKGSLGRIEQMVTR